MHGYAYQTALLSPDEVEYWDARISRDVDSTGYLGTINEGDDYVVREQMRRSSVCFLDPWDSEYSDREEDAMMARRLLYLIMGFAEVSAGSVLSSLDVDLHYGQDTHIQLARYCIGENYGIHRDTASTYEGRQVSVVITIKAADGGGQFRFQEVVLSKEMRECLNTPGTAVAFPSWAYHCVEPVTEGTRLSITTWVTGTQRK